MVGGSDGRRQKLDLSETTEADETTEVTEVANEFEQP